MNTLSFSFRPLALLGTMAAAVLMLPALASAQETDACSNYDGLQKIICLRRGNTMFESQTNRLESVREKVDDCSKYSGIQRSLCVRSIGLRSIRNTATDTCTDLTGVDYRLCIREQVQQTNSNRLRLREDVLSYCRGRADYTACVRAYRNRASETTTDEETEASYDVRNLRIRSNANYRYQIRACARLESYTKIRECQDGLIGQ